MDHEITIQLKFTSERDGDLYQQVKEELKLTRPRNRASRIKQLLHVALTSREIQIQTSVLSALKPAANTMAKNESNKGQDENRKIAALLVLLAARLDSK